MSMLTCALASQRVSTVAGVFERSGYLDESIGVEALFFNPHGIARDAAGNLYVADRYNHVIRKITPQGAVSTLAGRAGQPGSQDGPAQNATFFEPWGLWASEQGELWVADTRNNKIRHISLSGQVSTLAGSGAFGHLDGPAAVARFSNPTDIVRADDGAFFVVDHLSHTIRQISAQGQVSTLAGRPDTAGDADGRGTAAYFNRPYGLALDYSGNIVVADEWNHKIRRITRQGEVTTLAGSGVLGHQDGDAGQAQFNYPWDVAVAPNGTVLVGDGYNYLIRSISPAGAVSTLAGASQLPGGSDGEARLASFNGPTSLVIDPQSFDIYIADAYNHLIRRISEHGANTLAEENATFLPSAFTPNGDGVNDVFRVRGLREDLPVAFSIFDQWGRRIFYTEDAQEGWDGAFLEQAAAPATYVYLLLYQNEHGQPQRLTGLVTLHH
jgi:gliding motility-associated-like protein